MIGRVWHGFTSLQDADLYENLLRHEILPGISKVNGYKGAQLFRRNLEKETEFITITYFNDLEAVKAFAGEELTRAVIHPEAAPLLTHYDEHSSHFELVEVITPGFIPAE